MRSDGSPSVTTEPARDGTTDGALSQILRRFGHSLRSPLNEISGTARLMLSAADEPEDRQNLANIEDAADQILDVLNDLLDVAELDGGSLLIQNVPFRLPDVIREAVRSQRTLAAARNIDLSVHGLSALPTDLVGDPGRIRQVIGHIVADAVRTAPHGRVQLAAQLTDQSQTHATIRFGVRRPTPLTPDEFEDLVRPLTTPPASATRTDGLGLLIASRVIAALGGRLSVSESTNDTLLEFSLTFDRQVVADSGDTDSAPSQWVVVISEHAAHGADIVEGLRVGGFEPTLYESVPVAATALAMSDGEATAPAAIVLAPLDAPFEMAQRASASSVLSRSHLVLVVAHGERGDGEQCIRLGVDGYFPQPVAAVDLIEGVALLATRNSAGPLVTRHSLRERRKELRVLVVDDSPTGRAIVMRSLEQLGHTTQGAGTGTAAIDALQDADFDVVIMDMEMPEMGGIEATKRIRQLPSHVSRTPIIGLSAHAFSADRQACIDAGMNEHFTKPFRVEEIQIAMDRITRS